MSDGTRAIPAPDASTGKIRIRVRRRSSPPRCKRSLNTTADSLRHQRRNSSNTSLNPTPSPTDNALQKPSYLGENKPPPLPFPRLIAISKLVQKIHAQKKEPGKDLLAKNTIHPPSRPSTPNPSLSPTSTITNKPAVTPRDRNYPAEINKSTIQLPLPVHHDGVFLSYLFFEEFNASGKYPLARPSNSRPKMTRQMHASEMILRAILVKSYLFLNIERVHCTGTLREEERERETESNSTANISNDKIVHAVFTLGRTISIVPTNK